MKQADMEELELIELLHSDLKQENIKNMIQTFHPFEVAEAIQELDQDTIDLVYQLFTPDELAIYFEQFEPNFASKQFTYLKPRVSSTILEKMAKDDAVAVLREIEPLKRIKLINLMKKELSLEIKRMLEYDINTIGSIIDPDFIQISRNLTVKEASKQMIKQAKTVDNLDYIYVLEEGKLIGVLSLRELLTASSTDIIENIMNDNLQFLRTNDDQEDAVKIMQRYDLGALPIVNEFDFMVGIVTVDDIIDVIEEETNEDFGKFAAISTGEIGTVDEKTFVSVKKRIPWLLFLLLIGIFTSSIIASFENTIATIAILAVFLPLVLDMSGNVGTQSLATTIRLLSSDQLNEKKEVYRHLRRELGIGILNAITVSVLVVLVVFIFQMIQNGRYDIIYLKTAVIIGSSMSIALVVTNLSGALIPIIISRLKIDPATASGPFITTLSDIISLFIYFGFATIFLL